MVSHEVSDQPRVEFDRLPQTDLNQSKTPTIANRSILDPSVNSNSSQLHPATTTISSSPAPTSHSDHSSNALASSRSRPSSPFPPSHHHSHPHPDHAPILQQSSLSPQPPHPLASNPSSTNGPYTKPFSPSPMNTKDHNDTRTQLFVSNLPFRVRWQDLKDLMRKCGTVLRADVALSPVDGRSRGFGVVLYARNEDALKAIEVYHGYTWQTRVLDVRIDSADPKGELALAEANRQNALQQQAQHYQMLHHQHTFQHHPQPQQFPWPSPGMMMMVPAPPNQPAFHPPPPSLAQSNSSFGADTSRLSPGGGSDGPGSSSSHSPSLLSASTPATSIDGSSSDNRGTATPGSRTPQLAPASIPLQQMQQGDQVSRQAIPAFARGGSGQNLNRGPIPHPPTMPSPMPSMMMMMPPPPQPMMGAQGPMRGYSQGQPQRPQGPQLIPPQFIGRHLFVGNLPFNCQWQELKDLMRSAGGSVLRADIAQGSDGRSRGFGSVLFANAADAERAVSMFNGHEFNGRTLKVHFDKFAYSGMGPPNGQGGTGYSSSNGGPPGWPSQPPYPQHPTPGGAYFDQRDPRFVQQAHSPMMAWPQVPRDMVVPVTLQDRQPLPLHELSEKVRLAHKAELDGEEDSPHPLANGDAQEADAATTSSTERRSSTTTVESEESPRESHPRPGRIAMPPSYPFGSGGPLSATAGPLSPGGAFSPLVGRLPPMTPSMPAFTLGAFPQTPPLHPASFFSPGVGPFSPQVGSPFFGPGAGYGLNAAPGAPLHSNYNPMFPPMMPDEPYYHPNMPHEQMEIQRASSYHSEDDSKTPPASVGLADPSTTNRNDSQPAEYFTSKSPASTGQISPSSLDASLAALKLSAATSSSSVEAQIDGWASAEPAADGWASASISPTEDTANLLNPQNSVRRKSFVPGVTESASRLDDGFDIRRRFEGENGSGSGELNLGSPSAGRRASSGEEGQRRPKFGTSSVLA